MPKVTCICSLNTGRSGTRGSVSCPGLGGREITGPWVGYRDSEEWELEGVEAEAKRNSALHGT